MIATLREILARRDLLYMLTWREVRLKYKQSVMGLLWAVLMPGLIVGAGIIVRYAFQVMSGKPFELNDILTVSVKSIPWAFCVSAIRFATNSLISNVSLVTKVYMPREIFPITAILSQFVDFLVAVVLFAIALAVAGVGVNIELLWVPVLIAILIAQVVGLGLILSAGSLFFRDVKYIVEVVLTFGIFFTPVFYDVSSFGKWSTALMLNPVAPVLEGLADVVVRHTPPPLPWIGYSAAVGVGVCLISLTLFKRLEPYFAERI